MSEWMPIKTAPKDGTNILLADIWPPGVYDCHPVCGFWNETAAKWELTWDGQLTEEWTHWAPLPNIPKAAP